MVAQYPSKRYDKSGSVIWHCKCDCGNEIDVPYNSLVYCNQKSCGCQKKEHDQKLQTFLTHVAGTSVDMLKSKKIPTDNTTGYKGVYLIRGKYVAKIVFQNETIVGQTLLQTGKTKSCGCIQKDIYKDNLKLVDGTSVTILEANKNRLIASNTSGYTGVYQNKKNGKWVAQITFKRKSYYLGSYEKIEDAIKARQRGEEMHDDFLEWYYQQKAENEKEEINK